MMRPLAEFHPENFPKIFEFFGAVLITGILMLAVGAIISALFFVVLRAFGGLLDRMNESHSERQKRREKMAQEKLHAAKIKQIENALKRIGDHHV